MSENLVLKEPRTLSEDLPPVGPIAFGLWRYTTEKLEEATELLEHFQWKNEKQSLEHIQDKKTEIEDNLKISMYSKEFRIYLKKQSVL